MVRGNLRGCATSVLARLRLCRRPALSRLADCLADLSYPVRDTFEVE